MLRDKITVNRVVTFAAILLVALVSWQMISVASSDEFQNYMDDSAEWCEEHGGELYNSQSVAHGGLHCELENGTTVHMSKVVTPRGESETTTSRLSTVPPSAPAA